MRDLDVSLLGVSVDDRDPQAIFDAMVATAQARLPEWQAANGSLETVVMEATAVGLADLIYSSNRVLGALTEGILNLYGVGRDPGLPCEGEVTLTLASTLTYTVPMGTLLRLVDVEALLIVTADVTVTAGAITVPVASVAAGGYLNGTPVGSVVDPVDPLPNVVSAEVSTELAGGADAEDDAAYIARASARLARVTSALVTAESFVAYALEDVLVGRAAVADQYNPDAEGDPGDHPGYVAVYLYGKGVALSAEALTLMEQNMVARAAAILTVNVETVTPVEVDVTATISVATGYTASAVIASCEDALAGWLNWQQSGFGADVDPLDVQAIIENVPGVDSVDTLTAPGALVDIPFNSFATLGTVSVTAP